MSLYPSNVSKAEITAFRNLSNNDLVITHPNKKYEVILLNHFDCVSKVETILNYASKFIMLDCDPLELCQKREKMLSSFLRDSLLSNKAIPQDVYHELVTSGSTPGFMYSLPEVYKSDCPVKPILSAIGTYNYKIANFLVPNLQPLTFMALYC